MTRTKRIILFTIIFLFSFQIYLIVWLTGGKQLTEQEIVIDEGIFYQGNYNNNLQGCVWIPNWAIKDSYASLKKNIDIDCISPVMYEVNSDGSLVELSKGKWDDIIEYAVAKNIEIIPTIAMFDHEIFTQVLQNEEAFQKHYEQLVTITDNVNFSGIDLDYESTKYSDKEQYDKLIISLSEELHKRDKKLIITVLSKWGDYIVYQSLKETRKVQDWKFLAKYADRIRIMSYDFTYSKSKYPGPIAPLTWMEDIIKYALTKAPSEKFELGIHLYSTQWTTEADTAIEADAIPFMFITDYIQNSFDSTVKTSSFDHEVVNSVISSNQGRILTFEGEKIFVYQKFDNSTKKYTNKVLVYIDREGVIERQKLAAKYGLYGVAYWRLGKEGDLLMSN